SWAKQEDDLALVLARDFLGPMLLDYEPIRSVQWGKLRRAFKLVRHLAYLTLDAPITGLQWAPAIPALLQHVLLAADGRLEDVDAAISEALSPLERATYAAIYHSSRARRETVRVAQQVDDRLEAAADPAGEVREWLKPWLFRDLGLGRYRPPRVNAVVTLSFRSPFFGPGGRPSDIEDQLRAAGFTHPGVFEYSAWNSDAMIEPDEHVIDVQSRYPVRARDIGRVILWIMRHYDDLQADTSSILALWRKADLDLAYRACLARVVEIECPGIALHVQPWPINEFGIFGDFELLEGRGAVWASNGRLDSPIVRRLLRDRSRSIDPDLRPRFHELLGLRALRMRLRMRSAAHEPRQRWLVVAGGVEFWRDRRRLIEFDGALVRISARSGKITFFGLEAKRGRENPLRSLKRRVSPLGIEPAFWSVGPDYAVLELQCRD